MLVACTVPSPTRTTGKVLLSTTATWTGGAGADCGALGDCGDVPPERKCWTSPKTTTAHAPAANGQRHRRSLAGGRRASCPIEGSVLCGCCSCTGSRSMGSQRTGWSRCLAHDLGLPESFLHRITPIKGLTRRWLRRLYPSKLWLCCREVPGGGRGPGISPRTPYGRFQLRLAATGNVWALIGHRGEHGPTGEEGLQVGKHAVALGPLGVGGDGGHVRGEHNVVEDLEAIRNGGLVREDVECGAGDGAGFQGVA